MPVNGRRKGNSFENKVAKLILDAATRAGLQVSRKDCYRTPLSGGHPFGDTGDLIFEGALREVFRFTVECKHYKNWHPGRIFRIGERERGWLAQSVTAAKRSKDPRQPLLVMAGNFIPPCAASPALLDYLPGGVNFIQFKYDGVVWRMADLEVFLMQYFSRAVPQRRSSSSSS